MKSNKASTAHGSESQPVSPEQTAALRGEESTGGEATPLPAKRYTLPSLDRWLSTERGYLLPFPYDFLAYVAVGFEFIVLYRYLMHVSFAGKYFAYEPTLPRWPAGLLVVTILIFLLIKNPIVRAVVVAVAIETPAFFMYVQRAPSIIVISWFSLGALAAGITIICDMFKDLQSKAKDIKESSDNQHRRWATDFLAQECRFYLERLVQGMIILGTILGVCMTILWTAPGERFTTTAEAVYLASGDMVLGFGLTTLALALWVGLPLWHALAQLRQLTVPR